MKKEQTMYAKISLVVLLAHLALVNSYPALNILKCDPDQFLDSIGLIDSRGFLSETHRVTTADGYILSVHRLRSPCSIERRPRPTVLHHGLLETSRTFLVSSPGGHIDESEYANETNVGNTIAFELGKRCFDVWLPNSRGNKYSQEHRIYTNKSLEFWDFSYDEMIRYDLPAVVDYILEETEHKNLDYIGHSQGTLIMFGLLSTRQDFNKKINKFIALAPVARVQHIHTPFKYFSKLYLLFSWMNKAKGPFMLSTTAKQYITRFICNSPVRSLCSNVLFAISGFSNNNLNLTRIGVYSAEYPGGTSFKNMVHWLQGIRSGDFKRYDYGSKNFDIYGQSIPPKYDLKQITHPNIYLFSARNDWLAPPEDVDFIRSEIGSKPKVDYVVPNDQFNHNDFMFALRSGELVNQKIYNILTDKPYF